MNIDNELIEKVASSNMAENKGWKGILGFDYGIVQAPMGPDISGPDLVAAVANAGCLGFLRVPPWNDAPGPEALRKAIRKTKSLTTKPFGVELILKFEFSNNLKVILEEKVGFLGTYWGAPSKDIVQKAHAAGMKVVSQIGSVLDAKNCIENGVDALIVQGMEAGGHVRGQESLVALVPKVVDLVKSRHPNVVVIAAGAIVDGRGYVAALGLGADGAALGTRFLATEESYAHPDYKKLVVKHDKTEYQNCYGRANWPNAAERILAVGAGPFLRCLPPPVTEIDPPQPVIGRGVFWEKEVEITYYSEFPPNKTSTGQFELMALYCGEGVGLINDIPPAKDVVNRIIKQAQKILSEI